MEGKFIKAIKEQNKFSMFSDENISRWYQDLSKYDIDVLVAFLKSKGLKVDVSEDIVKGTYSSVWEGEGEITSPANINLFTHEIEILKSYDPSEMTTEDGEPFECEYLQEEYVLIAGSKFPCMNKEEYDKVQLNKDTSYNLDQLFWYR